VATGHNGYIARGEYGRILAGFLRVFRRDQLKVVFSGDLANDPGALLPSVFDYIGVTPGFLPDNLDKRYRTAAAQRRVRGLDLKRWQERIARVSVARTMWHHLPSRSSEALSQATASAAYRVELWNAKRNAGEASIDAEVERRLVEHFRSDSNELANLLEVQVPWLSRW